MKQALSVVVALLVLDTFSEELAGLESWGGRSAHPAVVNAVCGPEKADVVSLRGEWEFVAYPMKHPQRNSHDNPDFWRRSWPNARMISVPGCWEAQGVGEPGMSESWECKFDHNPKPLHHKYMGDGWYRKTVSIPTEWAGKLIWLKVGGVRSQGWFWVNGRQVALVNNYCGTYKYDITDCVAPGGLATVIAQVNNVVPSRKGLFSAMHRWGGIYRDVELEATPQTFIDDAWVRGDFDGKAAEAHVTVSTFSGSKEQCQIRFAVEGRTAVEPVAEDGETVLRLPLVDFRAWSPEHPNLYTGIVELVMGGTVIHRRHERFGVRKLEVDGDAFRLNGKPFYMRGFGDDFVYPLTGISPADRGLHLEHLRLARKAGFNFVRLHTHCELPEYFEAADEAGILVQAELPYMSDVPTEHFTFDPAGDVAELYTHYRRHPSFAVYSMGNEGTFGPDLSVRLHRLVKALDADRLKINQDSQYAKVNGPGTADFRGGPVNVWPRGSVNPPVPFVCHEYLNLCVKLDSRIEGDFTGAWAPPVTRESRGRWLAKRDLGAAWGDRLQNAQHALQRHYQKRGIEWARKDPFCDGYCFWTIVDVVVAQGESYTAQGLFDPFWRPKRCGFTAEDFAQFNSSTCLLLDTPDENRVFTSGETMPADFLVAHYGDAELKDAVLTWRLVGGGEGAVRLGDVLLGPARKVASVQIAFPSVEKPVKTVLTASIGNVSNAWAFWVFPPRECRDGRRLAVSPSLSKAFSRLYRGAALAGTEAARHAAVVVAEAGSAEAETALGQGRSVVAIGAAQGVPNASLGWWFMGEQVGTALLDHPVFGDLPHEGFLSPLLFRIVGRGRSLKHAARDERDLFMVGEGGGDCFVYLARRKVGAGRLLESFGLDLLSGKPEGTAILDGMISAALDGLAE